MTRRLLFAVLIFSATAASAASVGRTFRVVEHFALIPNGTLILENPVGDIEITGADGESQVEADVLKTVVATDADGIEEGRFLTELVVGGDNNTRVLRTVMGGPRKKQWSSSVFWRVRVPRTANVRVASTSSNHVRVTSVRGNVYVKNFNGTIYFDNDTGPVTADSANGTILYTAASVQSETHLSTLNGHITVRVNANADLRWIAETIGGDIRTNLPVRGMFAGPAFRGSLNAPGGTLLSTATLTGNIHLLGNGIPAQEPIQSVRSLEKILIPPEQINQSNTGIRRGVIEGSITYNTMAGDVVITEVRGGALLSTNAGKVQLGSVFGDATVRSNGGLQLGEILGALKASTTAGDIFVEAARRGGIIETRGGTIRLLYTGGPTRLVSGGGDIVVRQAAGPVDASTHSGDITIGVDRATRKQKIDAETEKGNILLNVGPAFGADFDLTVTTSDPGSHTIQADFPGLSISREQADGKTRIRATGKINGGGERVTLTAADGSIRIVTAPVGPAVLGR